MEAKMTARHVNRVSAAIPLLCSAAAFVIVIANIATGVPPQPDENASAHIFQLLIVVQIPLIGLFAAGADWNHWRRPAALLGAQALAIAAALLAVWLAGY
jgi:hypothetical protein